MSNDYKLVQESLAFRYPGHGIANNNTQYYQVIGGNVTFIQNAGGYAGAAIDTIAYPPSACTDRVTPGNCIIDAQIQAEVARVINMLHLSAGPNRIFLLYTSSGEGRALLWPARSAPIQTIALITAISRLVEPRSSVEFLLQFEEGGGSPAPKLVRRDAVVADLGIGAVVVRAQIADLVALAREPGVQQRIGSSEMARRFARDWSFPLPVPRPEIASSLRASQ